MIDESDNPFITIAEAARILRVKRRTLDNLRWKNEGPPFRRHGGRIVYHRDDVLKWSELRCASTQRPEAREEPSAQRSNGDQRRCSLRHMAKSEPSMPPLEYQP
jgi:predicted DNA-binding transcriptional regulator AlpA